MSAFTREIIAVLVLAALLTGCARPPPPPGAYRVRGETYLPLTTAEGFTEVGLASWYGPGFHGKKTANGETYDMHARTAAHKLLPFGTLVRVTNLQNNAACLARINDRGPFISGRVIDLSYTLAEEIGVAGPGTARVRIDAVKGPEGTAPPPQTLEGPFAWQVGAFTVRTNADALARSLSPDFADVAVLVYDRGDAMFHRVRVGRYSGTHEAQTAGPALRARGLDPLLVRTD